jgi:uncharacterized membrane protein (DUF485 family)
MINQHDAILFLLHYVITPLYISGQFVAHHLEAECIMWRMVLVLPLTLSQLMSYIYIYIYIWRS